MYIFYDKYEYLEDPMLSLKRNTWLPVFTIWWIISAFQPSAESSWIKPLQPSFAGGELVCLAAHPKDHTRFLVANRSQIFERSSSSGWHMLWSSAGRQANIKKILTFPLLPDQVFVLTPEEILMGDLRSGAWAPFYSSGGNLDKSPLSFTLDPANPNLWFAGTSKGLWLTENSGKTWSRSELVPSEKAVPLLHYAEDRLFIGSGNSIYLVQREISPKPVFELSQKEKDFLEAEEPVDNHTVFYHTRIFELIEAPAASGHFFLGTDDGVFETPDGGLNWFPLPQSGLQSTVIADLVFSEKTNLLFAATPRGVFQYQSGKKSWRALSQGLARANSRSLAIMNESTLAAITGDGFVQYPFSPEAPETMSLFMPGAETLEIFKKLITLEPSARDIQREAIRYANVSNWKTRRWHAASRAAALIPSLSFGKTMYRNSSLSTYSGKFITGPEDVNKTFDTDISWDLGDALFSSSQTSIDSREKLMVDLRRDILSETTRIYYERRRLQIDLVYTPSLSEQEHLERLIRLDELSALLDALTDGFLSKRLEEIYERNVELNRLWIFSNPDATLNAQSATAYTHN